MADDEIVSRLRASLAGRESPPPASAEELAGAERRIGQAIPPFLRRLYLEVADGGFGPGHGVKGIGRHPRARLYEDICDFLYARGPAPDSNLSGFVEIYDWGCAVVSLVDFTDPGAPMWAIDNGFLFPEDVSLREWITMSLDGTLRMPCAEDHPECATIWDFERA